MCSSDLEAQRGTGAFGGASGYPVRTPVVDLVEIGAGGGSVAWVDSGGALRVGPHSAGADPGPVCYGLGGTEPTITDANLVLGRLDPNYFAGGEMSLDVAASREAIREGCAEPLGLSIEEAAYGIIEIANTAMVNALRLVSVQRGHDPRDFMLIAFGGAGPAHAVRMISDVVLKPVVGREIVGRHLAALRTRGFDDAKLGGLASLIIEELRKGLDTERTKQAETFFKAEVEAGRIQFRLRLDGRNWRMPFSVETTEPMNARQLISNTGGTLEKSLFAPVYENELNGEEREVAVYLDGDMALDWWHRNVARMQYGIQGWKKAKIYPDFIFAVQGDGKAKRITVLETKGDRSEERRVGKECRSRWSPEP